MYQFRKIMLFALSLIIFQCFSTEGWGQYTASPAYPTLTSGGNSSNSGNYMEMNCQVSGTSGTFRVERTSPTGFLGGTMYLRENSTTGNIIASKTVAQGSLQETFNTTFSHTSSYKDYYVTLDASSSSFSAWTGRMRVNYSAPPTTPVTPSNFAVAVIVNSTQIRLTWNDVSGETQYKIYRGNSSSSLSYYDNVSANTDTYYDNSTSSSTQYCYRIQACNGSSNCSAYTSTICRTTPSNTPSVPNLSSVTPYNTSNYIRVFWQDVANETNYELYRNVNGGSYSFLQSVGASNVDVVYNDYGLTPGIQYCYKLKACNGSDCSAFSNTKCTTIIDTPDDVASLTASIYNTNQVQLNWTAVSNITNYQIERKDPGQNWLVIENTYSAAATSYIDAGVIPGETYQYRIRAENGSTVSGYTYSNNITIPGTPASITITYPVGGETFTSGQTININWNNNNFSGNVYVKYNLEGAWQFATTNISNTGTYSWTIPSVSVTDNNAKVSVASLDGSIIDESNVFTVNPSTTSGACTYSDVDDDTPWASAAATYLCNQGVLDDDGQAEPIVNLNRAELAKMCYFALDLDLNSHVQGEVLFYPSSYNDLQNPSIWYYDYAKTLSYLEYGNCKTPFDRSAFNFYPSSGIERKFVVKAILEAFNVTIPTNPGSIPLADVDINDEIYPYIYQAYTDGIIIGDGGTNNFRPNDMTIRAEAFVMLANAMQTYTVNIADSDFYESGNYTPTNFAQAGGGHSGNFNFYTKTSFRIPSIGLPLNFGHTYNSYLGDMPKEFFAVQPMGNGWSHSYNMYVLDIPDSDANVNDGRIVLVMPDGTIQVFKPNGTQYEAETEGVYSKLSKIDPYTFQLRTKSQVIFTFILYPQQLNSFGTRLYQLERIQDRNNNTVQLSYINGNGTPYKLLSEVSGTSGRKLRFFYTNNQLTRVTDPSNRNIYYNYATQANDKAQLTTFTNAKGDNTTYTYGTSECDASLLMRITLPKGNTIDNTYEDRKLKSTASNTSGITNFSRNYVHNSAGTITNTTTTLPDYGTITAQYNDRGVPTSIDTESGTTTFAYTSSSHPNMPKEITSSSFSGTVFYNYNQNAEVTQIDLPMGVTHQFTYNLRNDLVSYTNPAGNTWSYAFDGNGNVITQNTPRGTTSFSRLSNGLVWKVTNPEGIVTEIDYDAYGNVEGVEMPAENISSSAEYDVISRLTRAVNPNGQQTTYVYDENDNLVSSTYGYQTQYEYDKNDNLTKIINAKGNATTLTYDFDRDFHTETSFGGMNDTYDYYEDGRLKTYNDPKGTTFTYNYDSEERISSINSPGDNVSYGYDGMDRVTSITNPLGTVQFGYDNLNRVTSTSDTYGNSVAYTYNQLGNVIGITYPGNKTVDYTYYADNLLHTVTDWNNQTTTYTYRNDGLLSSIAYPNGTSCTYTYDGVGRNTGQTWAKSGTTIASYTRVFDPFGNITSENGMQPLSATSPTDKNIAYNYTAQNQITAAGSTTFGTNDDGTQSSKSGVYSYTFDNYERLTGVSGNLTASFKYDALGHRREKTVNGTTTRFVLDILGMSKVLMEQSSSGAVQNYYIYGLGLISRIGANGSTTHYYHGDYRGSVIAMTNASGTVTHQYAYGAYGQNAGISEPAGDSNPFRYVGIYGVQYEADDLYFMRARYYDSETGRFLSEDPIWSLNLYSYSTNNPIMNTDPLGEFSWKEFINGTLYIGAGLAGITAAVATIAGVTTATPLLALAIAGGAIIGLTGGSLSIAKGIDVLANGCGSAVPTSLLEVTGLVIDETTSTENVQEALAFVDTALSARGILPGSDKLLDIVTGIVGGVAGGVADISSLLCDD